MTTKERDALLDLLATAENLLLHTPKNNSTADRWKVIDAARVVLHVISPATILAGEKENHGKK